MAAHFLVSSCHRNWPCSLDLALSTKLARAARVRDASWRCSRVGVVGGGDKGGIIARVGEDVRTADLAEERLATGALLTELAQLGDRLHFRKLCGSGPAEGWVSLRLQSGKALVERVPALWCVVSASGVLVRTGSSTSEEVAGRLLMGSFLEEEQVVLEGTRLQYRLRLGQGPATGWVSIALQQKDPTMMH